MNRFISFDTRSDDVGKYRFVEKLLRMTVLRVHDYNM